MISQTSQLSLRAISAWQGENVPTRTASRRKRSLPDIADVSTPEYDSRECDGVVASTSAFVSVPGTKRAKRAETRECPICGEHIPLRLLGQHYTLESSRVQAILDHVGDLECFSDPHALAHAPSIARRRTTLHHRGGSTAFPARLEKTISTIKRRRKARNMALRAVTRDEDDVPITGKGKGRSRPAAEQCPVCMQDVEGDLDVIAAHVDACLAHAELHRPGGSVDAEGDGGALQNIEANVENGEDDVWEESETPDGVRRLRLRQGARAGAAALGFVLRNRTVEDVDDEIDVEGDDLSAFGAAQFTEADILIEGGDSEPSKHDSVRRMAEAEVEVDLAIERARHAKDSQTLITALESKVRLLTGAAANGNGAAFGCRICLEVYVEPTVSVGCWHVCCSACWLHCLDASGVCPICKRITLRSNLRRIYL